jgi:hypothetical protein
LLALLLQMLKSMAENARAENRDNFFVQLLVSCFEFLLTVSTKTPTADVCRHARSGARACSSYVAN